LIFKAILFSYAKMLGQLDWDGVVLPIEHVEWRSVVGTARRLQGLQVNEDFFVTYKDEDGDSIQVKNQEDLDEAIRWAEEQSVPCLCLHVPFDTPESDSDESWMEVDNEQVAKNAGDSFGSRFAKSELVEEVAEEEETSNGVTVLTPSTESEVPVEVVTPAAEEQNEVAAEVNHTELAVEEHEDEDASDMPELQRAQPLGEVTVEDEVEEDEDKLQEEAQDQDEASDELYVIDEKVEPEVVQAPVLTKVSPHLDRFVDMLYSLNGDDEVTNSADQLKDRLTKIFANPESLNRTVAILCDPRVQGVISAIAQADSSKDGVVLRCATTQMLKLVSTMPTFTEMIAEVEHLENVILNVLRLLKPTKKVLMRSVHSSVVCDGCDGNAERSAVSLANGNRAPTGEIAGVRYKSAMLPDYDLCESCEESGVFQDRAGPFLKIVDPKSAPEMILCIAPGATAGMMSQVESLDWRNPIANEFLEFVRSRQQKAFPQQRRSAKAEVEVAEAQVPVSVPVKEESVEEETPVETAVVAAEVVPTVAAVSAQTARCKHLLKTFETSHGGYICDICNAVQAPRSVMHGCRECNFDVCQKCQGVRGFLLQEPPAVVSLPQAKFVSDVTLADGCVVRPGEALQKTWRVRNSGADKWPVGTRIAHVGGDSFGGPLQGVEVPLAGSGEAVNVTVPLVMPSQPGRYTSYWRLMTPHPANAKFGHRFWVTVNVVAAPPPPSAVPRYPMSVPQVAPAFPTTLPGSPAIFHRPAPSAPTMAVPAVADADDLIIPPQYEVAVAQITELGFADIDKIVKLLKEVNGDPAAVIDRLFAE
jgi:hypothetical protein